METLHILWQKTRTLVGDVANEESNEIIFSYQDSETKVTEEKEIQEITNEKTPDASEEVKTGKNTTLIVPVTIGTLVVAGIILQIILLRSSKG
mgnify:CR=1 FL=1